MIGSTEVSFIDGGVDSLEFIDRKQLEKAYSLSLHHNLIRRIEQLSSATKLRHIDLSSNLITEIRGLECLSLLRTLDLSSNRLRRVEGLKHLRSLVRLDLSFNQLENLDGLKELHGDTYRLTVIHLQGNKLTSVEHLICCTVGLICLKQLTTYDREIETNNPLCNIPNYRQLVLGGLPQLEILDNLDADGRPVRLDVLADLPEMARFLDYVSSSSLSEANEIERKIQEAYILDGQSCPVQMNSLEPSILQTESHNMHVDPGESSSDHPQCSLSPLTERRLINLEKQLSSLVAMQLMRLNEPATVKSSSQPPSPLAIPALIQSPATTTTQPSPTVHPFCANNTKLEHTHLTTLRSNEVSRGDLGEDDEFPCASDEKQLGRMNGTNGVKSRHSRSKSSEPLNEVPNKRATGEQPSTMQNSVRKFHDNCRSQAMCKPSPISTDQNRQLACHDVDGLYHTAPADEEHPPGAPKRPAVNVKTVKPTNPHPVHGKSAVTHRPSSVPGASLEMIRTSAPPCFSGNDLGTSTKNVPRRNNQAMKRGDAQELHRAPVKSVFNRTGNDMANKTLSQLLRDLDLERNQRKEAEQLCRDLTERIFRLEATTANESDTLEATKKLKQAFAAERRARIAAESQLRELDGRISEVFSAVDTMRVREAVEKSRVSEETNKMSIRLVELAKDYQDAIGRAELAEKKLDEAQRALEAKKLEFKELRETRYTMDNPELTQLIAARIEAAEARYSQTVKTLQEKLDAANDRFTTLEDEFRMALRIEADRYNELFTSSELLKSRVDELNGINKELEQREESARQMISELTEALKESKSKATNQQKSNLLAQHNQKERIATLEAHLVEARSRLAEMENLKTEQKQLKAELAAQESLVAGLRAERRNWSEELAQQSSALAQDRGRLESKIEAQAIEIVSLKKSLDNEADAVKIKTKIIDDQADSIRNLKKALMDTQNEVKQTQTESLQIQQKLEDRISQLSRELEDGASRIEQLLMRKEQLKDTVAELETKLDELRSQNSTINNRWRDRTALLDKLEKQVDQMRRGWDEEQQLLIAERDEAKSRAVALQSRMEEMDASFRKQLSVTIEANDRAISAARSDAEMIRSCCENRVAEVEAEMRAVLEETEEARVAMEARLRKISTVLYDQPSNDCIPFPNRLVSHRFYSHTCPRVDEWNASPPPLSVVRTTVSSTPSSSARRGPSPPSSVVPSTHSCSRGAHPNSLAEREVGPSCKPSACRSPHD